MPTFPRGKCLSMSTVCPREEYCIYRTPTFETKVNACIFSKAIAIFRTSFPGPMGLCYKVRLGIRCYSLKWHNFEGHNFIRVSIR